MTPLKPLAGLVLLAAVLPARSDKPNVLFLFADDQRRDTVAAHGNPHIDTPHLDRLAKAGFSFRNHYCMGSRHGAVCAPSRAMLMSGRTLHRVRDDLCGVVTLPQTLAAAGYVTFGTGKWHNRRPAFLRSFRYGKNVFLGGMSDHNEVPLVDLDPTGERFVDKRVGDGHSSELFADAAIEFLGKHAAKRERRPFFAYVSFTAPHDPRDPPKRYRDAYYAKRPPLPPNFRGQHGLNFDLGVLTLRDEVLAAWPRTEDVVRDQLAEYYGLITHLDEQVGRILAALEEHGFAEDTIVVYSADHGLAAGSHGLLGKQSLYEHSMGCPLIVGGPGIPKGETSALTYLLDLYPTLCELTGAAVPKSVEGKSLAGILRGDTAGVRDSLFTLYRDSQRAVRGERWKLIRFPKIDRTLLFDLQEDPHEITDLAGDPEQSARVTELTRLLKQWQLRTGDTLAWTADNVQQAEIDLSGRGRKPDRHQPEWIRKKYFK